MTEARAAGRRSAAPAVIRFLSDALARPLGAGVRLVTVPAPVGEPERLLEGGAARGRAGIFWTTPGGPVYAGLGAAATVSGTGPGRFGEVRTAADRLWRGIDAVTHPDVTPVPPRLFGGFAFLPGSAAPEWRAFGDATFILPRLLYVRDGDRAYLSVAMVAEAPEADGTAVVAEARSLLEGLARTGRTAPGTVASGGDAPGTAGGDARDGTATVAVEPDPGARTEWERAVASIQRRIRAGEAAKIVAARSRSVVVGRADVGAVLDRLGLESATAARFAFRLGPSVFMGATPERLVNRSGLEVRTEALAGSVPAGAPEREARLLASLKDEAEHGYVVRAIEDALAPLCTELDFPSEPRVQRLRHVVHLQTPFVGRLQRGVHVLELVERLHPTPAVGGLPTDPALEWIRREEAGTRGWYAAPVGWFDASGDGEFGVALRSALIHDGRARLYAGAGIVRDSDARAEFEETEVKLRTMLDALGAMA